MATADVMMLYVAAAEMPIESSRNPKTRFAARNENPITMLYSP